MSLNFVLINRPDGNWINTRNFEGIGRYILSQDSGSVTVERRNGSNIQTWIRKLDTEGIYAIDIASVTRLSGFDRLVILPGKNAWCEIVIGDQTDSDPFENMIPNRWKLALGAKLSYEALRIDRYGEFLNRKVTMTLQDATSALKALKHTEALILSKKNWRSCNLRPVMFPISEL